MDKRNQELRDRGNAIREKQAKDAVAAAAMRQQSHNAAMENIQKLNEPVQWAQGGGSSWVQPGPDVDTGSGIKGANRNDAWRLVALAVAGFAGWKTFLAAQLTYPIGGAVLAAAVATILAYMVVNSYVVRDLAFALVKIAAVLALVGFALYAFSHFIR